MANMSAFQANDASSILAARTKIGQKSELRRTSAVFSLVLRSKNQMFSEGGETFGAAVGCAFLDFSRHWRFLV
jgi:hypothetical protein